MTNKSARAIVNEWLVSQGYAPPADTLDYFRYARECRRIVGGKYPDTIDSRAQACRLVREFAQLALDKQQEERIRARFRDEPTTDAAQ